MHLIAMGTNLDILVIENYILYKKNQKIEINKDYFKNLNLIE